MEAFWQTVIRPVLDHIHPAVIVEIGIDAGQTTQHLVAYAKNHGALLHAIDPSPAAPMDEWQRTHGDALRFHRSTSLEALRSIDRCDAVLIDGDHNWHTVLHELRLIAKQRERHGRFPIVFLHDADWPYGRRDMYYAPERIPAEHRQPYAKIGMEPGEDALTATGMNSEFFNALLPAPERSGVLGAVDAFLTENEGLRFACVPGWYGLGILAEDSLFATVPLLRDFADASRSELVRAHMWSLEQERFRLLRRCAHLMESEKENRTLRGMLAQEQASLARMERSKSWRWTATLRKWEDRLRRPPAPR